MKRLAVVILTVVMVLGGLGSVYGADRLNGAGATFPYPVYAAWAWQYSKESGVKINYQSIGSGGGVRQIINRTVDFGASDAPLPPEEIEKNKLLQ
ncbi:MAG: extracellular solute-binding protein, partial [Nitrospirae bacterium]